MKKSRESSKDRISDAALKLFTENGINSTTTKAIAKKARVAEGTIYIYFKSKDELAYSLFLEHMTRFREILEDSVNGTDNPFGAVNELIGSFYNFAKKEPLKYEYIIIGHHTELKKMPPVKAKPKDVVVRTIKEGIKEGSFRKVDPNIAASYVIGMITRSIMFHKNGLIKCSHRKLVSETRDSVRRLLSA